MVAYVRPHISLARVRITRRCSCFLRSANKIILILTGRKEIVRKGILARYFDETSWRNSGKRHYAWIAANSVAAYYKIDPNWSRAAFIRIIGSNLQSPAVTDRYS